MNGNFASRLFTGLVVISLGVAFLLRQLGFLSFSIGDLISTYWPCILLYFGMTSILAGSSHGGSGWWGAILILIGAVFLGNNLNLMTWSIGDLIPFLIPIAIICIGLRMLWSPRSKRQSPPSDEWKSYRPYHDGHVVPPAPPLHPDPTQADSREAEASQSYEAGSARQAAGAYSGEHMRNKGYSSYGKKKKNGCQSSKEHVEWWNHDSTVINRSGFIGDIHMGQEYWELKPMNISHFIGDTVLDLTKANIPPGETKITISSFIGDVKVYVPNDYELGVKVVTSAFIGDVKVLGQRDGGLFTNISSHSPGYSESDRRIKLVVSTFIGDTRVTKVG
ncbi:cell wall-active antibiotics response protein LiaF [Paenibacillus sp. PL2-23]|uniref:cell wall-active antibiotics response protein LiaF n=1 Tax=Paenibacillus sp. PL2-23 TaxID=2100729 RepID=UPI0030F60657